MNYKKFFSIQNIAEALFNILSNSKQIDKLDDFKNSDMSKHHRNQDDDIWKRVSCYIIDKNIKTNIHRFTKNRYATKGDYIFKKQYADFKLIYNKL